MLSSHRRSKVDRPGHLSLEHLRLETATHHRDPQSVERVGSAVNYWISSRKESQAAKQRPKDYVSSMPSPSEKSITISEENRWESFIINIFMQLPQIDKIGSRWLARPICCPNSNHGVKQGTLMWCSRQGPNTPLHSPQHCSILWLRGGQRTCERHPRIFRACVSLQGVKFGKLELVFELNGERNFDSKRQ